MPASSAHASGLAGRYAVALFELAQEQCELDRVAGDLHRLREMLAESADLARLIRSPVLSREQQARALTTLGQRADFAPLTRQFLALLAHKRRLFALPEVIAAYDGLLAEQRGEVGAEERSAPTPHGTEFRHLSRSAAVGGGRLRNPLPRAACTPGSAMLFDRRCF